MPATTSPSIRSVSSRTHHTLSLDELSRELVQSFRPPWAPRRRDLPWPLTAVPLSFVKALTEFRSWASYEDDELVGVCPDARPGQSDIDEDDRRAEIFITR
jgi:hypothetical protein